MESTISLVADCGHTYTRIGYSGDDWPRMTTESWVAFNYEQQSVAGDVDPLSELPQTTKPKLNIFSGEKLHGYNLGMTYEPLWKDSSIAFNSKLGDLFSSYFLPSLNLEARSMPLLMSEPNGVTKEERKALLATFLETGVASHFFCMRQSLLSLYSCGKINGAVIDSSSFLTSVSTIEEGYFVPEGYVKIQNGGEILTEKIAEMIDPRSNNILPDALKIDDIDLSSLDENYFEFERKNLARKIKHALISQTSKLLVTRRKF